MLRRVMAVIAGAGYGIRWGESPLVSGRATNQVLIEPRSAAGLVYHPGFASDGNWVLAAHSEALDHNEGPYDVYIYELDAARNATGEELLLEGVQSGAASPLTKQDWSELRAEVAERLQKRRGGRGKKSR